LPAELAGNVRESFAACGRESVALTFRAARGRRGPPASLRVAPQSLIAALEGAGLSARVSPISLPGQYLVEARRRAWKPHP
jgi:hypothetical protein